MSNKGVLTCLTVLLAGPVLAQNSASPDPTTKVPEAKSVAPTNKQAVDENQVAVERRAAKVRAINDEWHRQRNELNAEKSRKWREIQGEWKRKFREISEQDLSREERKEKTTAIAEEKDKKLAENRKLHFEKQAQIDNARNENRALAIAAGGKLLVKPVLTGPAGAANSPTQSAAPESAVNAARATPSVSGSADESAPTPATSSLPNGLPTNTEIPGIDLPKGNLPSLPAEEVLGTEEAEGQVSAVSAASGTTVPDGMPPNIGTPPVDLTSSLPPTESPGDEIVRNNVSADEMRRREQMFAAAQEQRRRADAPRGGNTDGFLGQNDPQHTPFDCDDSNRRVNPNAAEECNYIDDDCDGTADRDPVTGAPLFQTLYLDRDGDLHGDPATGSSLCPQVTRDAETGAYMVTHGNDCDDFDANKWNNCNEQQ